MKPANRGVVLLVVLALSAISMAGCAMPEGPSAEQRVFRVVPSLIVCDPDGEPFPHMSYSVRFFDSEGSAQPNGTMDVRIQSLDENRSTNDQPAWDTLAEHSVEFSSTDSRWQSYVAENVTGHELIIRSDAPVDHNETYGLAVTAWMHDERRVRGFDAVSVGNDDQTADDNSFQSTLRTCGAPGG